MSKVATLLTLTAITVPECDRQTGPSADGLAKAGDRDYLVGWYKLPARHRRTRKPIPDRPGTLIPVLKIDGTYYSVCRGWEAPLKECPEGLEWAFTPSSMVGTTIGFNETSNAYYIIIEDQGLATNYEPYISGERRPMTRIDKPSGLLDATAKRPRTNHDFLGRYQPVWPPWFRFEIRRDRDRYVLVMPRLDGKGQEEPRELTPLPDRLGFTGFDRQKKHRLTYNDALRRFELTKTGSCVIRMPLARVSPAPSSQRGAVPQPHMRIGIPSWH